MFAHLSCLVSSSVMHGLLIKFLPVVFNFTKQLTKYQNTGNKNNNNKSNSRKSELKYGGKCFVTCILTAASPTVSLN